MCLCCLTADACGQPKGCAQKAADACGQPTGCAHKAAYAPGKPMVVDSQRAGPGWEALRAMRECGDERFRERLEASRAADARGEPIGGTVAWIETR